ncbi:MAG: NAD(+)/NADH kinase [Gaiellaceae bacterium]
MTSTSESIVQSQPPDVVRRAAVVTHGKPQAIGSALARLANVAREAGVELVEDASDDAGDDAAAVDLAVVLGGDGTMLRALTRYLGTGIPVIGVNFGRVGFLASIPRHDLEGGLARVFAGEYTVEELPTLDVEVGAERRVAVNDLVVASAVVGRMIQLEWAVGGEGLGRLACDGVVCATPSGSTGYNFSNGGPVLVWGLDAMAITFVAPHSLNARPLVVPRDDELIVWNRTSDVSATALVDGRRVGDLAPGARAVARLGPQRSLLATLPELPFFSRYSRTFAS